MIRRAEDVAGVCQICGCTDDECNNCVRRTGAPCSWANNSRTLCSACVPLMAVLTQAAAAIETVQRDVQRYLINVRREIAERDR